MGECSESPSAAAVDTPEPPGLDALLRDGGGVTVDRGDGGEDSDEIEPPLVALRLIADAADSRRPREEERSDEPRMRWLYLSIASGSGWHVKCLVIIPVLRREPSTAWQICACDVRP